VSDFINYWIMKQQIQYMQAGSLSENLR